MTSARGAIVTGGAGFIGSHIVDELLRRGVETTVIDKFTTGSMENLRRHEGNALLHVVAGDVMQIKQLLGNTDGIGTVFHEAAIANVLMSVRDPMLVHDVNVTATLEVMNFCVDRRIGKFIFASSAAAYGVVDIPPASEDMVCHPQSPYGASKLAVEGYLSAYRRTYGLETTALRYFNAYGPRQRSDDYSGVITVFTNNLLLGKTPAVYGDGLQTRDFVNVKDIVQANMLAMESDAAAGGVFNVASGVSTSVLQLLETLKAATGASDAEPRFAPPRPGDVREGSASIARIREVLGYRPSVDPTVGLSEVVDYIRNANAVAASAPSPAV
ncbi:MAG: NAD-dependent epimerase/dehydratase family protein [Nitrososphaerales archaeon]|jgi:UDP-glucose 4-epimerase